MDPSHYLPYSQAPAGLPQESKLVTYMNRSPSTPTRSLNQAMGGMNLESSPPADQKQVMITEFVPISYYSPTNILPESPENTPPMVMPLVANPQILHNPQIHLHPQIHLNHHNTQVHQENVGGTTYFYSTNENVNPGLNPAMGAECLGAMASPYATQMYAHEMAPPHMTGLSASEDLAATFYLPETIRAEIYERNNAAFMQPDPCQIPELPDYVDSYGDLIPLETLTPHSIASSFRGTHRNTGEHLAMRRLHGFSSPSTKRIEAWKLIDHPNIVHLHDIFFTKSFGDHSMVVLYDYHPGCETLMDKYLRNVPTNPDAAVYHDPFSNDPDAPRPYTHQKNAMLRAVASGALLPEAVLWSLLIQLTSALRAIHSAGLACRALDLTKVVTNGCRLRISWGGVPDGLNIHNGDILQAQQEDLAALGRLTLSLACRTVHCDNLTASIDLVSRSYSSDLKNMILYLMSAPTVHRTVTDLMPMIGARFYTQVEALERRADAFEDQLAHEIDNGRLLRILIKMGIINERPELNMDPSWSETGDRYMLKLFRDYLFHSVSEDGKPWIDQAHLVHCLNQLDGGTQTKVELMSRDEQSVLVVSYSELKHCLDQAHEEVMQAAGPLP